MITEMTQLGPPSSSKLLSGGTTMEDQVYFSGDLYEVVNANDCRNK